MNDFDHLANPTDFGNAGLCNVDGVGLNQGLKAKQARDVFACSNGHTLGAHAG